jgi:5-methylcytosine-specific restriction endonuclease McrA
MILTKKKTKNKRKRKDSPNKSFYQSEYWKRGPPRVFLVENKICAWYGKRKECKKDAKIVDHKMAITDEGSLTDQSNWQALCKSCSAAKTNMEVALRRTRKAGLITPTGIKYD